jgi:lysophospholipase L1-like esterase
MNSNRRVVQFVTGSVCIYLLLSLAGSLVNIKWMPFRRINLVSDVMSGQQIPLTLTLADSTTVVVEDKPDKNFDLYLKPKFITSFSADLSKPSLNNFMQDLKDLKTGKKKKVRIAYFGDSMIEGDLLTQTLRQLLQQSFGGSGVGYVPITSQVSKFRQTVTHNYSGGWDDENFKNAKTGKLYLSGHLFRSDGDWVQMTDQTIADSTAVIEKSLLCGNSQGGINITVNNYNQTINASGTFNRIPLAADKNSSIKLSVSDSRFPIYGISFESQTGIIVDNFSFRGITGIEYAKIDAAFLDAIAANNPYDLIVFQYGVNLLFRPNDRNFNWYAKSMLPIVQKLRKSFPAADFLVVSTADRAFRYGGEYKSAVGIDSLIKIQATIAYETGSSFYNQFASMGGTNSIVDWAKRNPSLANKDYVHPNHRGAEILARYLFEAMMNEYNKYTRTLPGAK